MKKIVCWLLTAVLLALCASCGRPSAEPETTTAQTTAAETSATETTQEMTEEATTGETATEPETTAVNTEKLDAYCRRISADTWVEVCDDPSYAIRAQFAEDGGLQMVYACEDEDGQRVTDRSSYLAEDRSYWEDEVHYYHESSGLVCFVDDIEQDDFIHYDGEGVISDHRLMIRESLYNGKTDLADRLKNTKWKSALFAKNGVDTVSVSDFDVYPVNETTAHLVYRSMLGSDKIRVTVVQTTDHGTLDAYVISTYAEMGYCPETSFHAEQWTAVEG